MLQWANEIKYVGVLFIAGLRLKCDGDYISRKFHADSDSLDGWPPWKAERRRHESIRRLEP